MSHLGPVDQVVMAWDPRNRLALVLGALLGAVVPLASYVEAHLGLVPGLDLWTQLPAFLVLGGLAYSATTVYQWGKGAFGSGVKALGFCVLLEGVMVGSHTTWLSLVALGYLVGINAVATGCTLALGRTSKVRRRASTRARGKVASGTFRRAA